MCSQCAQFNHHPPRRMKGAVMPSITGSFSARITEQTMLPLTDQPNHQLGIAEIKGTQSSPDPLWNNSNITYWGVTDVLSGQGSQRGYFNNVHADMGRDWGTFQAQVTATDGAMTVEGTFEFA